MAKTTKALEPGPIRSTTAHRALLDASPGNLTPPELEALGLVSTDRPTMGQRLE